MADETVIAWTDHTFNPWMGCTRVSEGCRNCYAERLTRERMGLARLWKGTRQVTIASNWKKPIAWNRKARSEGKRSKVFCASLCDVFEDHPTAGATRPRLWDLIRMSRELDWQLLTKRPENIARFLPPDWGEGWPHVWLGTSIESNDVVERADYLRQIPAIVRFVSYEPALGPLDRLNLEGIDWVIYGGESGPGFRGHEVAWARTMHRMCAAAGAAFFYKQSPGIRTEMGVELDGKIVREYPRIRPDRLRSAG